MKIFVRFTLLFFVGVSLFGLGSLAQIAIPVTNASVTGTVLNSTATINSSANAVIANTSNTTIPTYIVTGGAGTTGQAQLAMLGQVLCVMDSNVTAAAWYYVINSTSIAGDCHAQITTPAPGTWIIGYLSTTTTAAGVAALVNVNSYIYGGNAPATSSGIISTGANRQLPVFTAAGNTVGPSGSLYTLDPSMNQSQINTFLSGLSGSNTVFIPAGMPQIGFTNPSGQVPHSFRLQDDWFQMPGVACDGGITALSISITQGSNTSNVGALFSNNDVNKTFFFAKKSGYVYGFTQQVWAAKLLAYSFPTATWSANAPFGENAQVWYGTDNWQAISDAMTKASSIFPLTLPTGCYLLANGTIKWNHSQSIVGRHQQAGGIIGRPGIDTIATTDTSGEGISSAGVSMIKYANVVGTEIDATYPHTYYAPDGTPTLIPGLYRPGQMNSSNANNPCGNNWVSGGCFNGVGSITAGSASMTIPAGIKLPIVSNKLVFPYLTKVFSTVADAVNSGTRVVTMHDNAPTGSTGSQQEWFAGGTAFQSTSTSIPGSPVYPFNIQLTLPVKPNATGGISNMAQFGVAKLQDYEFEYGGLNYLTGVMTVRRGPATINGGTGYATAGPVVPLNPCPVKNMIAGTSDQPWPVTPTINSGDSTPSGAGYFPGACVGNAGIAFPTANGNTFVGSGLVDGYLQDLEFIPSSVQNTNNVAKIYIAGNNAPFASTIDNIKGQGFQYGIIQGPASSGQHGVTLVGPTGFGNTIHNLHFFDAFPLSLSDMQGSTIDGLNFNSTMISPWDGTAIGSATCLQEGYTLDEQTGGVSTSFLFNGHHVYGCEPENGSHIIVPFAVDIQGSNISFDTANFEGIPNVFGGDHLSIRNSQLSFPTIDQGSFNDFGVANGNAPPFITNIWDGSAQFFEWGKMGKCQLSSGIACGPSTIQGYEGRGIEPSMFDTNPFYLYGGRINPWMWNNNGSFDSNPMTTTGTFDTTAPYWNASASCALGGGRICHVAAFYGFNGYMFIGPENQLAPIKYRLTAHFKSLTASSSFNLVISAEDNGSGQCATGGYTALTNFPVSTTTSFTPFRGIVDLSGSTGCALGVQFFNGSTSDSVVVDDFNLVPVSQSPVPGLASAPTYPGSCAAGTPPGSFLGTFSGFSYYCDGTTVKRSAVN